MANELTKTEEAFLEVITTTNLQELIKPLQQEIHLLDTYISEINKVKDVSVFSQLHEGSELILKREPSKFDDNEIAVYFNETRLGIIPEKDNVVFARLMDAGKMLKASIIDIDRTINFRHIRISLLMVDY